MNPFVVRKFYGHLLMFSLLYVAIAELLDNAVDEVCDIVVLASCFLV